VADDAGGELGAFSVRPPGRFGSWVGRLAVGRLQAEMHVGAVAGTVRERLRREAGANSRRGGRPSRTTSFTITMRSPAATPTAGLQLNS